MLTLILIVVAGAGWTARRTLRAVQHGIPRSNDDLIFF